MTITVLVTGAGGGVGQGVIKALRLIRDLDIRIVAADMSPLSAGLYAGDRVVLVPKASAPNYVDAILEVCKRERVDVYVPGTDVELLVCAENAQRMRDAGVDVVIGPPEAVRIADDKLLTARFLAEHGLPHPQTWLPGGANDAALDLDALPYPVVVKPRIGCRSIGVSVAKSRADVERRLASEQGLVVQERVGDDDSEFTCTCVVVDGVPSDVVVLRRWLRDGDTFRAIPVRHEAIESYVRSVAVALKMRGSCNFQLRVDAAGVPKLFEINARFSGTTPFCAELGMNPVEDYLKRSRGIPYRPSLRTDVVVLRYWTEIVVPASVIDGVRDAGAGGSAPRDLERFTLWGALDGKKALS